MKKTKARPKRKATVSTARTHAMFVRLNGDEMELIRQAAGHYPPATWARVELLKAAEQVLKGAKR